MNEQDGPLHLAITLNGAVALGAYEAGVVAQLYADVFEINQAAAGRKVLIDAISGASAGAVCATVLTQGLTTSLDPKSFTAQLSQLWTVDLNLLSLLGDTTNSAHSIFDPACLTKTANSLLKTNAELEAGWAVNRPGPIALYIGLTNLEGIPYAVSSADGSNTVAKAFADYDPYFVYQGQPYRTPSIESVTSFAVGQLGPALSWPDDVGHATITSGSFPAAFRTQVLNRDLIDDYPGYQLLSAMLPGQFPASMSFSYTDGGVLNNEPISRAIDASAYIDQFYGEDDLDWTYIIVEPDPVTPTDALASLKSQQPEGDEETNGVRMLGLGGRLISAYFTDALYRDLSTVLKTNDRITALNQALNELNLNDAAKERILEATGLDFKKPIEIGHITSTTRLRGAFLSHFGGFMYSPYQQADFYEGCTNTRTFMQAWAEQKGIPQPKSSLQAVDPGVTTCGWDGIPEDDRQEILDAIVNRIDALLEHELGISGFAVGFIHLFKGKIEAWISSSFANEGC